MSDIELLLRQQSMQCSTKPQQSTIDSLTDPLSSSLTDPLAVCAEPASAPTVAQNSAAWARNAYDKQDERFFDSTTNGFMDWAKSMKDGKAGYAKCNQFVAASFTEGAGVDYPSVDGRPPVVQELANPDNFKDDLTYTKDASQAKEGDMVLWYDKARGVHHSAVLTGYNDKGQPLVTYAGAGDLIKQVPVAYVTKSFQVAPAFRSWLEALPEGAP